MIFLQILKIIKFNYLNSWEECFRGILGFNIVILSNVACPHFLYNRIEEFIKKMKKEFSELQDKEFSQAIESVLIELTQKPTNIFRESSNYYREIYEHSYLFNRSNNNSKKNLLFYFKSWNI